MNAHVPSRVVLIHGLWMTPRSWENWAARYEERGHRVTAPAWPGLEVEVEELRRDPTPLTRLLADRGLSSAAVGVASATVKGVLDLPLSTIRSAFPVLGNPFNRGKATGLSAKQFHYAFGNTMSRAESDQVYERCYVPAANRVLFEVGLANLTPRAPTKVDFARGDRAPLLFAAFGEDHVIPAKASRHNAEKYRKSNAVTEFKEFPGRPHFPGAPGWEEVADYALDWAIRNGRGA